MFTNGTPLCNAQAKCDTVTRSIDVVVKVQHCEPRTTSFCNGPKKMPTQEKIHQEKCLNHVKESAPAPVVHHAPVHQAPAYHAPTPVYNHPHTVSISHPGK